MYAKITWDKEKGKKKAFFGAKWGEMSKESANATAIRTGDGLVVIDIDTKELEGVDSELVGLLGSPTVETARGYHYYFMVKDDSEFKTVSNIFPLVDMRANGGVIFDAYWGSDFRISYNKVGEVSDMSQELRDKLLTSKHLGGGGKEKVEAAVLPIAESTPHYSEKTDIKKMREILSFINPDESYDKWLHVGMGLKEWDKDDGFYLFDEWSRGGSKYNEKEMMHKWESFSGSGITAATIVMYAKDNGYVTQGVTDYGFDPLEVEEVEHEIITDSAPQAWFNKETEKYCIREGGDILRLSKQGFKQVLLSNGKKIKGSDINIQALREDYAPSCGAMVRDGVINTFTPSKLMDVSSVYGTTVNVPPTISLLFDNIFSEDALRYGFINWLAYIYQFRKRTGVVWIFKGVQGSGKGIVAETIMRGIFEHNMVCNLTDTQMNSQFNSIMEDKMIVHFNEISAEERRDRTAVKNKLKTWITDDTLVINSKGVKEYYKSNHMNIVINTNEVIPVDIDDKDRRFTVVHTDTPLVDLDWFTRGESIDEIKRELEAFAVYLSLYEVDKTAAHTAVMTKDKQNIIQATMNNAEGIAKAFKDGDFEYFMNAGLEEYIEKVDGFYDIVDIEREFGRRAVCNRYLGVMISAVYGKEINPKTWGRTIMTAHNVGERFRRKVNGKTVRGYDFLDAVTLDGIPF